MKKLLLIKDTLTNKISYYHILLFLIFLPFDRFYTELILISFLIHTLLHVKRQDLKTIPFKRIAILQSVFLLTLIGSIYSNNTPQAFAIATRQLAIFLFPLLFYLNPLDLKKYRHHFFSVFSFTCTLAILYLYFDAFRVIRYYHLPVSSLLSYSFINHNFSSPIDLHATYLSVYAAVSLVYFLTILYSSSFKRKGVVLMAALILTAGLIQLGSKAVLITIIIIFGLVFPVFYLEGKQRMRFTLLSVSFIILILATISQLPSFKERFFDDLKYDLEKDSSPYLIENPRIERWKLAWKLIASSPLTGHGSGDEVDLLKEEYFNNKLYNSYLFGLNAHNEYLSFLITTGIPGLVIYLFTLLYGFRLAFQRRDTLFLSFLLLISILSVSENYLTVNKGIFFYAFFFSFFVCSASRSKSKRLSETGNLSTHNSVFTLNEYTIVR